MSTIDHHSIRHKELLTPKDSLVGLTAKNEWDEIWKYAKIKDQEENAIKKSKKLAQKIQFNSDLKAQILENNKRKTKELQESKAKEQEELEDFLKKIRKEDNKKMVSKMKAMEQIKFNDHILLQKNKFKREMRKEQRKYDKGLVNGLVIENSNDNKRSFVDMNTSYISSKDPKTKWRPSPDQILQDKADQEEYSKIFEKLEKDKKDRYLKVKQAYDNQPKSIPKEREKNIYGLSVVEEETHMCNRMQKEAVEDQNNQYLKRVQKQK